MFTSPAKGRKKECTWKIEHLQFIFFQNIANKAKNSVGNDTDQKQCIIMPVNWNRPSSNWKLTEPRICMKWVTDGIFMA
jgi:hypothetical protein